MKRLLGLLILVIYFLVIVVALTEGPLISLNSLILGILGLIVITFLASELAKKINLVDSPDGHRKKHQGHVPLIGGISLFISLTYGAFVFGVDSFYYPLIASLIPIVIIGTIDGIKGIKVPISFRIIAQIIASWIVIGTTDVYVKEIGDIIGFGSITLGKLGIPFTIFGVVGLCNAFNMLDGKDGLAGIVSITIFSVLAAMFYLYGMIFNFGLIMILSLLIFLVFNLSFFGRERKIFLGDHGSTGLGHIIAWSLIFLSQENELISPVSALYFVSVPLLDALLTFYRRIRSSQPIFIADNLHFHHILSSVGYSDRAILFIIFSLTAVSSLFAATSNIISANDSALFFGFCTIFICLILSGVSASK